MKRFRTCILTMFLLGALALSGCGSSGGVFTNNYLFEMGEEKCSLKEARVYLTNMRESYENYMGTNLWEEIAAYASGDASAEEKLEDLVISRLLYIYCMDQMAAADGVSLSDSEKDAVSQAAEAYAATLSDADLDYLGVDQSDIEEYYTHFALAEKYYEQKTENVTLSSTATSEAEQEEMLAEAKAAAIESDYQAFLATIEITVYEDALSADEAEDEDVTTNQFFEIFNTYMN